MNIRPWKKLQQVPVNAWFRSSVTSGYLLRIISASDFTQEYGGPVLGFPGSLDDAQTVSLRKMAKDGWEYSTDLKTWHPCGLPTECPECGAPNLGYCIPEPETPTGWFCPRCKAPHVKAQAQAPVDLPPLE